jgi:hypothetical protein
MDPSSASRCSAVAARLGPLNLALRTLHVDGDDAFWIVYDEAVVELSRARSASESSVPSTVRDQLQEIMRLVVA